MAIINASSPVTFDQATYPNEVVNIYYQSPVDTEVTVLNTTGISEPLHITLHAQFPIPHINSLTLGEGANVVLDSVYAATHMLGQSYAYNLGAGSTLEFTPGAFSSPQFTASKINLDETGTSTLIFDTTNAPFALFPTVPTLSGVTQGDQIQVIGSTLVEYTGGQLLFKNADGVDIAIFNAPDLDPEMITFQNGTMSYACYLKGTSIATPEGETKVEDLQAGDKVRTASGGVATVKWIGFRTLRKARIPAKDAKRAFPITFKKDAVAPNVPHRDVTMSPGHHVSFDGQLVPAMLLVNGKTITQDFSVQVFEYFHIELEQFDIVLAEGLPAESYVDTGNRSMFQNAATVALNPDFGPARGRPKIAGIEVVRSGPKFEAIRRALLKRAAALSSHTAGEIVLAKSPERNALAANRRVG